MVGSLPTGIEVEPTGNKKESSPLKTFLFRNTSS
jgi:hypothetical protein